MNRYRFDYQEKTHEYLVYIELPDGGETLLGRATLGVAQNPKDLYAWANKQAALLSLATQE